MSELRKLEIQTCQRRKVALKAKSTYEAFNTLITKTVDEPRMKDLAATDYADKKLFENNETLTSTVKLRLYRNMVLNLKEDERKKREIDEKSKETKRKLEEKAGAADPRRIIVNAIRQVNQQDKDMQQGRTYGEKDLQVDYINMFQQYQQDPSEPINPRIRTKQQTKDEQNEFKAFLGKGPRNPAQVSREKGARKGTGWNKGKNKTKGKKGKGKGKNKGKNPKGKGKGKKGKGKGKNPWKNKGKGKGKKGKGKNRKGKGKGKGKKGGKHGPPAAGKNQDA